MLVISMVSMVSTVSTLTSKHLKCLHLLSRPCLSTRTNQLRPAGISTNTPQCLLPPSYTMRYYSLYFLHSALGSGDQVVAACGSKGLQLCPSMSLDEKVEGNFVLGSFCVGGMFGIGSIPLALFLFLLQ